MAVFLAVTSGIVATATIWPTGGGARSLIPQARGADVCIAATGIVSGWVAWPLWSAGSGATALATLMSGWDQASHASMFLDQRSGDVAPPLATASQPGAADYFDHYPQWQHSLMSLLAEFTGGPVRGPLNSELVLYAHIQWVLFVLIAIFAMAIALQRLPLSGSLRGATLLTGVVWSLLLGVPGAQSLYQGHLTFVVAAVAAGAIPPLSAGAGTRRPVTFAAICGLVVMAASWMLVLPLAVAAATPPMLSAVRKDRPRVRLPLLLLTAPAVASTLMLCLVSVGGDPAAHLDSGGAIIRPTLAAAIGVPVIVGAGCWWVLRVRCGLVSRTETLAGVRPVLVMCVVALTELLGLGLYQLLTKGVLDYYWWKTALGAELILLLSGAPILGSHLSTGIVIVRVHRLRRAAATWAGAIVCVLGLGTLGENPPIPSIAWLAGTPSSLRSEASIQAPSARLLLRLSSTPTDLALRTTLIGYRPGDPSGENLNQWLHTLTRTRNSSEAAQDDLLAAHPGHPEAIAAQLLRTPGSRIIVTDARVAARITSAVPSAAGRVTIAEP